MRAFAAAAAFALLAAGCAAPATTDSAVTCDLAAFRSIQLARADHTEVTVCGTVVRVGRIRRSRSGAHRIFLVDAGANDRVQIDANVDVMGNFPIRAGERAVVRGEYYYDGPGRDGVHWTHRTDRGSHPPGFIRLDGITYR